jgi:hypothetical protein
MLLFFFHQNAPIEDLGIYGLYAWGYNYHEGVSVSIPVEIVFRIADS